MSSLQHVISIKLRRQVRPLFGMSFAIRWALASRLHPSWDKAQRECPRRRISARVGGVGWGPSPEFISPEFIERKERAEREGHRRAPPCRVSAASWIRTAGQEHGTASPTLGGAASLTSPLPSPPVAPVTGK